MNRFNGACKVDGVAVTVGPLMATRMAGPPEAMAQEIEFLKIMEGVLSWRPTEGGVMLLKDGTAVAKLVRKG